MTTPKIDPAGRVSLAHGNGGRLMRELIDGVFASILGGPLDTQVDAATLPLGVAGPDWLITTDGFTVEPLEFPGGDIGSLAVHGTVNDLAMAGARPCWLAAAFVIEEGLAIAELETVVASMREAAAAAGVTVVTGDTKVVDRGKGDGLFVTTAGVGVVPPGVDVRPARVRPGDAVLLSGDVGRHGIAVLSVAPGPIASGFAARAGIQMTMSQTPDVVAAGALSALGRRSTARPGWLAKLLGWSIATLPRRLRVRLMGQIMSGMVDHGAAAATVPLLRR
jgi:thiamine monophosphate kinase